jgi:hypothetical protein
MRKPATRLAIALAALLTPQGAWAGAPFLTDDPEPTAIGHWEIYAPMFDAEWSAGDVEGAFAVEINYGAAKDVQLTIGLPAAFSQDSSGTRWGAGDLEASVKYRFYDDETAGTQIAFFPAVTLPTARHGLGADHVTALLPIWAQQDVGQWQIFGGGGYAINPGRGNRDYWTGGIAVARHVGDRLLIGVEADRQGPSSSGGRAQTSLGLGAVYDLPGPLQLFASAGPTLEDGGGSGLHSFLALAVDF